MHQLHWRPPAGMVTAAVDALQAGQCAAIDADGTLWDIDLGDELVAIAAALPELADRLDAPHYFEALAADHSLASAYSAWAADLLGDERARALTETAICPKIRARGELLAGLLAAEARGVRVVVVSASPVAALEAALGHVGLHPSALIGARSEGGVLSDPATLPVGVGKMAHWRDRGLPAPALAVGDSMWDVPLLSMASIGVMIAKMQVSPGGIGGER